MKFSFAYSNDFLELNSFKRMFAFSAVFALTFALTFMVLPFAEWKLHFYQAGIFTSSFLFGPFAGAAVGALSSSFNALAVLHNPYLIFGNAALGLFAALFYKRFGAFKAVLAAFAIQIPYLYYTDVYLMGMAPAIVGGIIATLAVSNAACALAASYFAPRIARLL